MKRNITLILAAAIVVATTVVATAAASSNSASTARASKGTVVALGKTALGKVLVDAHGRTLYAFAKDKHGRSACYGACATYWPVLVSSAKPRPGTGVRASLLGLTKRTDGRRQATYAGHPLYRFVGDKKAGDTTGEGLTDFGGAWDAIAATGRPVAATSPGSSGGGYGGYGPRH
jgi:predicted lipoprotein with Yx(FWY)xxD motif